MDQMESADSQTQNPPHENKKVVLLSRSSSGTTIKASSVLQKNSKLYGPVNALDYNNNLTCYSSEGSREGKMNFLKVEFHRKVQPTSISLQFQAGFVAEAVTVMSWNEDDAVDNKSRDPWKPIAELEVDDDHETQTFSLVQGDKSFDPPITTAIKIIFGECTDFYQRITLYELKVYGYEATE